MVNAKILIVEDEDGLRAMYRRALTERGHAVTSVADAEAAGVALLAERFDLILLDLILPGSTGLQALASFTILSKAPVIMLTGQCDDDTRRDAELLGAAGFLPKPVDLSALGSMIAAMPKREG